VHNLLDYSPADVMNAAYMLDFPKWCAECLMVRPEQGPRRQFKLYREQVYTAHILKLLRDGHRNAPALIRVYKARKRGISTMAVADMLHQMTFSHIERWGTIYGHENDSASLLFYILKTFYDSIPGFKPDTTRNTHKKLWFEGGSKIEVKSIKGDGLGLGETPDYLIMTEVSKYNRSSEIKEVMNGLAMTRQLTVIQESTSTGYDDFWYPSHLRNQDIVRHLIEKHKREITLPTREQELKGITPAAVLLKAGFWPKDEFFHLFIPWYWNSTNRIKDPNVIAETRETLSDYEKMIMEVYLLDLEQISWYRSRGNLLDDEMALRQGYPCSADESFISTGNCFFDPSKLSTLINKAVLLPTTQSIAASKGISEDALIGQLNLDKKLPRNTLVQCNLEYADGFAPKQKGMWYSEREKVKIEPVIDKLGKWYIFNPPEKDWVFRYLLAADCAEAKAESDDDCLGIWDMEAHKFVALMYGKVGVDRLPEVISKAASWYNFADVLVERNGLGQAVLMKLRYMYTHVIGIQYNKLVTGGDISTSSLGVSWTNKYNKEMAASYVKNFINSIPPDSDGSEIPFKDILTQMTYFMQHTLKADNQRRDDLVMMTFIAHEGERALREAGRVPKFLGDDKTQKKRRLMSQFEDSVPSSRCY